jgi:hypothetical protein
MHSSHRKRDPRPELVRTSSALLATVYLLVEWVQSFFHQVIRVACGTVLERMNLMLKISRQQTLLRNPTDNGATHFIIISATKIKAQAPEKTMRIPQRCEHH